MHVHTVEIKNFRLLKDVSLLFEEKTTVIVGRNNSGKTSMAEFFRRLLLENLPSFALEDFSLGVHGQFWDSYVLKKNGADDGQIREMLPIIEAKITLNYNENTDEFGVLTDFIIDVNEDCTKVLIVIRYQLEDGKIDTFFRDIKDDPSLSEDEQKKNLFRLVKDRVPKLYKISLVAVDPNDSTNQKALDWTKFRALIQSGFINAQRGLDDTTHKERDVLGKVLEVLFSTATSNSADPKDQTIAQELKAAVFNIQEGIDKHFNEQLTNLIPAFTLFGYPGLSDPKLCTETLLDVERLLSNHTKIRYSGVNGIHLPEAYNGLGARNLIYILLKLVEFFKSFKIKHPAPGIHLIFIEEPEAHLHPQMQEVFINKLSEIADVFAREYNNGQAWSVQFIVTTHSSHMANKAPFNVMRYFFATPDGEPEGICSTKIKNLRNGLGNTSEEDEAFLHQYMTLTRCDLLFADKAILIEGTSERLLMPRMIEKVEKDQPDHKKLACQYVSVMEVGGAYAHIFFDLLDFLELRTLVITDLDTINHTDNRKACKVSEGTRTSNACITTWFGNSDITPSELINKPYDEKIKGQHRLAYQIKEKPDAACGRSFEDAFVLANPDLFEITGDTAEKQEDESWSYVQKIKKSEFALKYAIEKTEWTVPRYIEEGLLWLAETPNCPITTEVATSDTLPPSAGVAHDQEASND